jgi:hypothetical protein
MKKLICSTLLALSGLGAQAVPLCPSPEAGSKLYNKGVQALMRLAEFQQWKLKHELPIIVTPLPDSTKAQANKCYWSISVFADHGDRLERWHDFLMNRQGQIVKIQSPTSGNWISIPLWRASEGL